MGLIALGVPVAGLPLGATILELPAAVPLGIDSRLVLELDNADVFVTSNAGSLGEFRARLATGASATLEDGGTIEDSAADKAIARVDVASSGGTLSVRRPDNELGSTVPRLRLDIELGPGRSLQITGANIALRAQDSVPEGNSRGGYALDLERSTVHLIRARISRLRAQESSLRLTDTKGALGLSLTGGSARLDGHQGALELEASHANVELLNHEGEIKPHLEGGSLEITAGRGAVVGETTGSDVFFDGWQGDVEVDASDGLLETRDTRSRSQWQLGGSSLAVVANRVWGSFAVTLQGGSFEGSELNGDLHVAIGAETTLEVDGLVGSLGIELSDGAHGWLSNIDGTADVTVSDGEVDGDNVRRLALRGARSRVSFRQVGELSSLDMADAELDLDLRQIVDSPELTLRGASFARVRLRQPCVVELADAESAEAAIDTGSCERLEPGQASTHRQPGGGRPIRLRVTTSLETVLEVDGEP